MIRLDEKSGEVLDKDISRPECPFRSITDLKRKFHTGCEKHVKGKTRTQAEQYVPMIKMIERMLRGEDVEFIHQMMAPLDLNKVQTEQDLDDIFDSIPDQDLDPSDLVNIPNLSTETGASVPPNEAEQATSSSGEVGDTKPDSNEDLK